MGYRHTDRPSATPTTVSGLVRGPDAVSWTARHEIDPTHDHRVRCRIRPEDHIAGSPFRRARRMLMSTHHRRVHRHVPPDPTRRIRGSLQRHHHRRPRAVTLPTPKQPIHRLPRPIRRRNIAPGRTDPNPPTDPVHQLAKRPLTRSTGPDTNRQQRHQHRPLLMVRSNRPATGIVCNEVSVHVLSWSKTRVPETSPICRSTTRQRDQLAARLSKRALVASAMRGLDWRSVCASALGRHGVR